MPRRFFKRFAPSRDKIKEHKHLKIFGELLHDPNLWHMNRRSVSGAFAVGLFIAWVPLPIQMILAAAAAIYFRTNLPISVALVWVTNPITVPPMFYFAYMVGTWVIGAPAEDFAFALSYEWLSNELATSWKPLLVGCFLLSIISSVIGYVTVSQFWVYAVLKRRSRGKDKTK